MTDRVVLDELGRQGAVRRLSADQVHVLNGLGLVDLHPRPDGTWLLQPTDRVGVVRYGDLEVQVRPKVGVARLLFLLGYARDPGFRPEDVDGIPEPDLWPALAHSLARQAERALQRGVLQGYLSVEDALPVVRGRIRLTDQITRRPATVVPIEVRYDDFAADIPENQILRTAIRRMLAVPGVDDAVRSRLSYLDTRLPTVRVIPHGAPIPSWRLTRLNARYAPALPLAELVLRHQSTEPGPGGLAVSAFMVSMPAVFEDFVTTALREALAPYPGRTYAQYDATLDEQNRVPIRPDVVYIMDGRPVAVFDAKYKREGASGRYGNADTYQMLAYCTALAVPTGWLVYAQGDDPPAVHRVRQTSIDIVHWPLDLQASPREILSQVNALATRAMAAGPAGLRPAPTVDAI